MGKFLNQRERQAIAAHAGHVNSVVAGFKSAVDHDTTIAPAAFRNRVLRGMWNFASVRSAMKEQMKVFAGYAKAGEFPEGSLMIITRLAFAAYLLDRLEKMRDATDRLPGTSYLAVFRNAQDAILRILDENYFSKTNTEIIGAFLDNDAAISSCARCAGVTLSSPSAAVTAYEDMIFDQIDAMNGLPPNSS
ncbi:hypothetical protein KKE38_04380 [Candidatus Micrarchaeota archaeon]|nr:hypothetical protein [Candidatus Micrarchaeota archaeon]